MILKRPGGGRTGFVLYACMADSEEAALEAVRLVVSPDDELEINGRPLSEQTAKALGLGPGEVRHL